MKNVLLVILLTCFSSHAQDKVKAPETKPQAEQQKTHASQPTPLIESQKPAPQSNPSKASAKKENDHPTEEITAWVSSYYAAWIAFGALILGIGQVIYIGRQLHVMARTLEANKVSADAAAASSESYIRSEAPHLFVRFVDVSPGGLPKKDERGKMFVTFEFANYGRTPATILTADAALRIEKKLPTKDDPDVFDYPFGESLVVVPNGASPLEKRTTVDDAPVFIELFDDEKYITFVGQLVYADIFENRHFYGFGLYFDLVAMGFKPFGGEFFNYRHITKPKQEKEKPKRLRFNLGRWPFFWG